MCAFKYVSMTCLMLQSTNRTDRQIDTHTERDTQTDRTQCHASFTDGKNRAKAARLSKPSCLVVITWHDVYART